MGKEMSLRRPTLPEKVQIVARKRIPSDWFSELELLRRLVKRAEVVNTPTKIQFSPRSLPLDDLRIATISSSLSTSDLTSSSHQGYTLWTCANDRTRGRLRKAFLRDLEEAAKSGARFVCFNELAYPTPINHKEDELFARRISELVKKHHFFLLAGSYHDSQNFYNICPVFSPIPSIEDGIEGSRVWRHAKLTNAVKVFEHLRVPSQRGLRYYETEYGTFTILIGLDTYSPELALRLITMNYAFNLSEKIEVIFVPAFTQEKSPSLANTCRDLSYLTASLVVYVNCAANEPRHAVFLAGEELSRGSKNTTVSTYRRRKVSDHLVIHEISYDWYHACRIDRTDSYNPVFKYLMGQKLGLRKDFNL